MNNSDIYLKWLGGAGFLIKLQSGIQICIDPYLSDSVERIAGFKRLMPAPFSADKLKFDLLLISHSHPDHLDEDSFDIMIAANKECKVIASADCEMFLSKKNVDYSITKPGDLNQFKTLSIKTMPADHLDLCPEAVGYIISDGSRKVYFTGDTALNQILLSSSIAEKPEILLTCINGAYGNMNEYDAARFAVLCGSKTVVPCHYGLFAEHNGDLSKFIRLLTEMSAEIRISASGAGEEIVI